MSTENPGNSAEHKPYVPDEQVMHEFTWSAVFVGAVLGIIFGASSLYLVLKVGMTVSASIPVAVLSITLFRWLGNTFGIRKATILENNITQTTGSAGESIAFGVGVTMPALLLIGFEMEWTRVMVVSVLGGLLGILMMIPLRRAFIVHMHGKPGDPGTLLYPEGTACAQVLITGEKGGMSGKTVFVGFGLAFVHKLLTEGFGLLVGTVSIPLRLGQAARDAFSRVASINTEMASELLGVGYIIGMRTSSVMMAGAVLGGLVLVPTLALSSDLSQKQLYETYLRSIGAGCVAAAGIISMGRTMPTIVKSFAAGMRGMSGNTISETPGHRTEDDLSMKYVFGGCILLLTLLAAFIMHELHGAFGVVNSLLFAVLGAGLVLIFGFLFVTVSSRLTGEIGSSSNPISGMTVATLLMTCLIFLALGMVEPLHAVLALSIGGVVCIAASNGGTTSQDLKTGFLLGATPRWQQWAILIGAITSAVVIGGTLLLFSSAGTVYSQRNLPKVVAKEQYDASNETMTVHGIDLDTDRTTEEFRAWRNNRVTALPMQLSPNDMAEAISQLVAASAGAPGASFAIVCQFMPRLEMVQPGIFLIDKNGQLCYQVDPTITGKVDQRDEVKSLGDIKGSLSAAEAGRLKSTFTVREGGKIRYYLLWRNDHEKADEEAKRSPEEKSKSEPVRTDIPDGLYLVAADGTLVRKVEGTKVSMKFSAPKTQVMGIIINGLLQGNLNWALVMIGACIAVMLEFCGVSSLAFAVGLYVPMQYSTPIFIGGLVRWYVDRHSVRQAKKLAADRKGSMTAEEAEVKAIAESETSAGMLLASGLIAGGSLGGVVVAFMEFLPPNIKDHLDLAKPIAAIFKKISESGGPLLQDTVAVILFGVLAALLLASGIGKIFAPPPPKT